MEAAAACSTLIHDVGSQLHSRQQSEAMLAEHIRSNATYSSDQITENIRAIASQCPSSDKIDASRMEWEQRMTEALGAMREAGELARKFADRERTRVADLPPYLPLDRVED